MSGLGAGALGCLPCPAPSGALDLPGAHRPVGPEETPVPPGMDVEQLIFQASLRARQCTEAQGPPPQRISGHHRGRFAFVPRSGIAGVGS